MKMEINPFSFLFYFSGGIFGIPFLEFHASASVFLHGDGHLGAILWQ